MKSSPKSNDMPTSAGSKTPASAKKLVQARLPFKTLGGSEPPSNDASDAVLATANTLTPVTDNRKRKQSATETKADGIRATKINRRVMDSSDDVVFLESTEAMESDLSAESETENGTKTMLSRNSESKENVCVGKSGADSATFSDSCNEPVEKVENANSAPKAKHSLEFDGERPEARKSKRNESSIRIKLPIVKKMKKTKKQKKVDQNDSTDNDVSLEEGKPQDNMNIDAVEYMNVDENVDDDADADADETSSSMGSDNEESTNIGEKSLLNDSLLSSTSDQCLTPAKMTPKQLQRRIESEKKKEEKELAKLERERKLQEEKEQRQLQKKREREEKEEQRKKEKEMREQKLLEEKLEKQREKEQKEHQKKIEREEKEEQRKREKEERDLQKKKEREDKDREKEEERKKKEDEKRQKIEAEQNKNRKTAEAFVKFFVPKKVENKSALNENDEKIDIEQVSQMFMSFQVKEDMKMAPVIRRTLNNAERSALEHTMESKNSTVDLYLSQLNSEAFVAKRTPRTWQDDEDDKSSNADDLFIIEEDGQGVQMIKEDPKKLYRAKFFKFHENRRPPYYGTWRKKSETVRPRKPFGLDTRLDYDLDSDDEWEEEEPGESLHGSDDEKEVESEDEYEIDNEFFVPHGHLSDEELQNEDESDFDDPENLKLKLKLAQSEFDVERKKKTQKLKPRLIGLIWQGPDGLKPDNCSNCVWESMNKQALMFNGPTVKVERPNNQQLDNSDDENTNTKTLGVRRLQIGEKEIPDLIRLINGNQNNSKFLVKEFGAYLAKNHQPQREYSGVSIKSKIKDLAKWTSYPEEGPMYRKMCWYVPIDKRKRYNVNDLTFPNAWSYTIQPPRRPGATNDVEGENKVTENNDVEKKADLADIIALSDDSNSCTLSETLTPELIKQASSKRQNYNIAKYIRPLTQDEKKKQFEPITFNRRPSEEFHQKDMNDTPSTSQTVEGMGGSERAIKLTSKSSSGASAPKKRLELLMSGPVGQEFSPKLKTTLVTQFLNNNLRKRKSTDVNSDVTQISANTAGTSDGAKKSKIDPKPNDSSVIVID